MKRNMVFVLGFFLLFQAVTSLISGAVLFKPNIVEGNIAETLVNMKMNYNQVHLSIFMDILTACGIVCLGVMLYYAGKKYQDVIATLGLVMYIFEAGLLVVSKLFVYVLVQISVSPELTYSGISTEATSNNYLFAKLMLDVSEFAYNIHIIPFGIGAICFYYLLTKSIVMPRWMSLWGLLTAPIILICVPLMTYGVAIPFVILLPYVPFEFVSGLYLMIKSLRNKGCYT